MKKALLISLLGLFVLPLQSSADEAVRGYYRKDGTYVAPHYRSSPDSSYNNNWSTSPNVNPYTGKQGTRQPTYNDRAPSYNSNSYGSRSTQQQPSYDYQQQPSYNYSNPYDSRSRRR